MHTGPVRAVYDVEPIDATDEHDELEDAPTDVERIAAAFDVPVELIDA